MNNNKFTPHQYQKDVVNQLLSKNKKNVLMALDFGLGKTLTSLYLISKIATETPIKVLILAQGQKLIDWKKEINRCAFITDPSIRIMNTKLKAKRHQQPHPNPKWDFILTTYGTFVSQYKKMSSHINNETYLIVDESQVLKSHKTNIGKIIAMFAPYWKGVQLLSGNPMGNGYQDYYNQLIVLGEDVGSYWTFTHTYCTFKRIVINGKTIETINGYKNEDKLIEIIGKYSVFMKTKDAIDLPKENEQTIIFNNIYANLLESHVKKHEIRVYKEINFDTISSLYVFARRITNASIPPYENVVVNRKLQELEIIINSSTSNFVIFYNFICELNTLKKYFKKENIPTYEINGSNNQYNILGNIKGRHMVLIQYQSGSKGLNLQAYNRLIQYSPTTSYDNYLQSLKRIHRAGQTKPVFYYFLIMNGSIEMNIREANSNKIDYTETQFTNDFLKKV